MSKEEDELFFSETISDFISLIDEQGLEPVVKSLKYNFPDHSQKLLEALRGKDRKVCALCRS